MLSARVIQVMCKDLFILSTIIATAAIATILSDILVHHGVGSTTQRNIVGRCAVDYYSIAYVTNPTEILIGLLIGQQSPE